MGDPDPNAKPKSKPADGREARLAEALRENLRRRKAAKTTADRSADEGSGPA